MSASAWIQCLRYARCPPTDLGGCCAPSGRLAGDPSHRMSLRPGTCARHRRARGHVRRCNASYALRHLESAYSVGQATMSSWACQRVQVSMRSRAADDVRVSVDALARMLMSMRSRACRIDALACMPNRCADAHAESMRWRTCRIDALACMPMHTRCSECTPSSRDSHRRCMRRICRRAFVIVRAPPIARVRYALPACARGRRRRPPRRSLPRVRMRTVTSRASCTSVTRLRAPLSSLSHDS